MMGMFPVADHPAVMLFDSGASHSFINRTFVVKHEIPIREYCILGWRGPVLVLGDLRVGWYM